jgi:zinc protease
MDSISFEKFTLPNGLDVILHQDRSLPLVSVNIWYHVGSKNEQPGKTGYAHLFEHLMFEGSKNHNRSHFEPLQKIGANLNGSTTPDRTNYWEDIPSNYLDLALWLESDRMGFLLDALDQHSFDIQRDVVKNERRQSYENRPYGMSSIKLQEALYPLPHPYNWPTIGFHEDLDVATIDDAREFFRIFYAPTNASLALAGDLDINKTKDLVSHYFSDLEPGKSVQRMNRMDSPLQGTTELILYDQVLLPRLTLAWPTVPRFHADEAPLSILATILGDGKSSRLYRTLVYGGRMAQSVMSFHGSSEISGDFNLIATAAEGQDVKEIEYRILEELDQLRNHIPSENELNRAKNQLEWRHVRQMTQLGGFGGKANRLNSFNVFAGDPALINTDINRYLSVTPEDISEVARKYLKGTAVRLLVQPQETRHKSFSSIDRTVQPGPSSSTVFVPPAPQSTKLATGLSLIVLEKRGVPLISSALVLKSGATTDPYNQPGLSSFTTAMLQEGTESRSSQQISEEFEFMGTQLDSSTGRESTLLQIETLSKHFPLALALMSDIIQNPTFPAEEFERIKTERLTSLRRIKDDPGTMAVRLSNAILYGADSPYGHPISGIEATVKDFTRQDLVNQFNRHFNLDNITLIIVGDISIEEATTLAKPLFSDVSQAPIESPTLDTSKAPLHLEEPTLYLLNKPGSAQSIIRAGYVAIPRDHVDYLPLTVVNHIFGGQFTARLNMNLRQDKGYSYGYNSWIEWQNKSSVFMSGGGVQTNVTKEAIAETLKEYNAIVSDRPITTDEFEASKASIIRQFPAGFETSNQILNHLIRLVTFGLPLDYYASHIDRIAALTLEQIRGAALGHIDSKKLMLLIVGDQEMIEQELKLLNLPIQNVGPEGQLL